MSSYYSKPADYGTYTQAVNLDLVNFVLSSKQSKYDYNLAKLEDKITNQLGAIDLARPQDKEYFLNKATDVLNSMGDISKLDYSKNGVTRQIDGRINSIVDERVLNDVVSTRNYRSFQSTLQEKQKKGDGSYDVKNAAHAMEVRGVNAWLEGEDKDGNSVGSLGTVAYQDYHDVSKEFKDISEHLDDYAHVVKKFDREVMYFINQDGKKLTASEVKSIASQLLSDKAKGQMVINGWYNYDGGDKNSTSQDVAGRFQKFAAGQYKELDINIADYRMRAEALKDTNPALSKEYKDGAEGMVEYKKKLVSDHSSWIEDPDRYRHSMTSNMEMENKLNAFGQAFAIDDVGDPVYSANPVALAEIRTKIELAKLEIATEAARQKYGGGDIAVVDPSYENKDKESASIFVSEIERDGGQVDGLVNQVYNNLTTEQKSVIDKETSKSEEGTLTERRLSAMDSLEYRNVSDYELMSQARELNRELQTKQIVYGGALQKSFEVVEGKNLDKIVGEYYDNESIPMVDPDTGKKIPVYEYLQRKEIPEDGGGAVLLEAKNKKVFNEVLKSQYADKIISESSGGLMSRFDKTRLSIAKAAARNGILTLGDTPEDNQKAIDELEKSSNVTKSTREVVRYTERLTDLFIEKDISRKEANLKAENYLAKVKSVGAYATGPLANAPKRPGLFFTVTPDASVTEDSTLNNWITLDKLDAETSKNLNQSTEDFTVRNKGFIIGAETPLGIDLSRRIQSKLINLDPKSPEKFSVAKGMSMSIQVIGEGLVEISATDDIKGAAVVKPVRMSMRNLPQGILDKIDFEKSKISYSEKNMRPISRSFMFPSLQDVSQIKFVERKLNLEPGRGTAITKDKTLNELQNTYSSLLGNSNKPTELGTAVENMLNSSNLVASIIEIDKQFYKQIGVKRGRDTEVLVRDQNPIDPSNYENIVRNMEVAPMIHLRERLESTLNLQKSYPNSKYSLLENIKLYYGTR